MVDNDELVAPIDCDKRNLPFFDLIQDAVSYIYVYEPYPFGFRIAMWWQNKGRECQRFAYDTGPITPTLPDVFHKELQDRVKSTSHLWRVAGY